MEENIFINYRRGEDQAAAGRLYDQLEAVFPREHIFIDVDSIMPGRDFTEELARRVAECDIFLAVIGRRWADVVDADGGRRLENPNDWVRIEIESAQRLGKHIIPVLVDGAEMPRPEKLPESLQPFTRRNAARLSHERFRADAQGLISVIGKLREAERAKLDAEQKEQARLEAAERAQAQRDAGRAAARQSAEASLEREVRHASAPAETVGPAKRGGMAIAIGALVALGLVGGGLGYVFLRSSPTPITAPASLEARAPASEAGGPATLGLSDLAKGVAKDYAAAAGPKAAPETDKQPSAGAATPAQQVQAGKDASRKEATAAPETEAAKSAMEPSAGAATPRPPERAPSSGAVATIGAEGSNAKAARPAGAAPSPAAQTADEAEGKTIAEAAKPSGSGAKSSAVLRARAAPAASPVAQTAEKGERKTIAEAGGATPESAIGEPAPQTVQPSPVGAIEDRKAAESLKVALAAPIAAPPAAAPAAEPAPASVQPSPVAAIDDRKAAEPLKTALAAPIAAPLAASPVAEPAPASVQPSPVAAIDDRKAAEPLKTALAAPIAAPPAAAPAAELAPKTIEPSPAAAIDDRKAAEALKTAPAAPIAATPAGPPSAVAALEPAKPDAAAFTPLIVAQLRRLDCYKGGAADWGAVELRIGVDKYAQYAKLTTIPTEPDQRLLDDLKGRPDHFCPPQCSPREIASGGQCVAKTCGRNEVLTREGACVAEPPPAPKPVVAARPAARAPAAAAAPAAGGGKHCFNFNGASYCE